MAERKGTISYRDFSGGLIEDRLAAAATTNSPKAFAPNEFPTFSNLTLRDRGRLTTRGGFVQLVASGAIGSLICPVPGGDAAIVTPAASKVVRFNSGTAAFADLLTTFTANCLHYFNGNVYAGSAAALQRIPIATWTPAAITGAPAAVLHMTDIGDRLYCAIGSTRKIQVSGLLTDSDWTSLDAGTIYLPDTSVNGYLLGGCRLGTRYLAFTPGGIWLCAWAPGGYACERVTSEATISASQRHTPVECVLAGLGLCVVFISAEGEVCAVTAGGQLVKPLTSRLTPATTASLQATWLEGQGLYLWVDTTKGGIYALHTAVKGFPVSKWTLGTGTPGAVARQVLAGRDRLLCSTAGGALLSHLDAHDEAPDFVRDDSLAGAFYQVQGKIRTRPEDAGSRDMKAWRRAVITGRVSTGVASPTVLLRQYLSDATDDYSDLTVTLSDRIEELLVGVREFTSLELSLSTSAASAVAAQQHLVEVGEIRLDFGKGPAR